MSYIYNVVREETPLALNGLNSKKKIQFTKIPNFKCKRDALNDGIYYMRDIASYNKNLTHKN